MSFQNLPNEIILEIAGHLNSCRDKNAFLQVNGHVHSLLHDELYRNNIRRHNGSGLAWAAERNRMNTARVFLSLGADPNGLHTPKNGTCWETPLHVAVRKGHLHMVQLLLDNGANPRAENRLTATPLFYALSPSREEIARVLVRHTDDFASFVQIRDIELLPIHLAVRLGNFNFVRWLVQDVGHDINRVDKFGRTALHFLQFSNDLSASEAIGMVMSLVDLGANFGCGPSCVPNEEEVTARDCLRGSSEPLVKAFFDKISCRCGIAMMAKILEYPKLLS